MQDSARSTLPLSSVLNAVLPDTPRMRRYQRSLDWQIDALKSEWDLDRGLRLAKGVALPHETVRGYWDMNAEERRAVTPVEAQKIYEANAGRAGTSYHCIAAFCYSSALSRHHHDRELLRYFEQGLRYYTGSVNRAGLMASYGLNGEGWAHGWDIESLIYGLIMLGDAVDASLLAQSRAVFKRMGRYLADVNKTPSTIGSYGNQRLVYALGLQLYGQYLGDEELLRASDFYFNDAAPNVLDSSGQVIEQMGPCMHYSHTAFFYGWVNYVVRAKPEAAELSRVLRCAQWFMKRSTRGLVPFAGPSTRQYYETMPTAVSDLLPVAEQFAQVDPTLRDWVDAAVLASGGFNEANGKYATNTGHGGSPVMWAMLMSAAASTVKAGMISAGEKGNGFYQHDSTTLLKRSPLKYLLVHKRYSTHFNFTDFLPFGGLQTFAWGDEQPILHPTVLYPSSTRGMGIDTARNGASHNWGLYGAGAIGIDGYFRTDDAQGVAWLVARYDWLWRVVVFTDASVTIVEFGKGGERTTRWTVARTPRVEVELGSPTVKFVGRRACLYAFGAGVPTLVEATEDDESAVGVRQIEYRIGAGMPAASSTRVIFALSDAGYKMEENSLAKPQASTGAIRFSDASGRYRVELSPRFDETPNVGNFGIDTFQMAATTKITRE